MSLHHLVNSGGKVASQASQMKSESPGKKIWKRFRRNRLSLFGMILILAAIFISFFCYLFIPDNTPYANRMSLALANLSPGYEVEFIKIKKQVEEEPSSFASKIFTGVKDTYTFIPVSTFRYDKANIIYQEFMGPGSASLTDQALSLPEAMFILKNGQKQVESGADISYVLSTDRKSVV